MEGKFHKYYIACKFNLSVLYRLVKNRKAYGNYRADKRYSQFRYFFKKEIRLGQLSLFLDLNTVGNAIFLANISS